VPVVGDEDDDDSEDPDPESRYLTQEEVWDDSVLIEAWDGMSVVGEKAPPRKRQ
jgi:hypothetical protein